MRLAVLGGGRREGEAAVWLAHQGHSVTAFGCSLPADAQALARPTTADALAGAEAVLLPALGPGDAEIEALRSLPPQVPVLTGRADARLGGRVLCYGSNPDFTTANAVPTAEAAIWEGTLLAGRTASGSGCVVLGFGRCGAAIARRLRALGAATTIVARRTAARDEADALGLRAVPFTALTEVARTADIVWNTVPALVLDRPTLACLPPHAVVVDLASAPGGTDFAAAEALGVTAVLAPGLPGRRFPRTAGEIVGRTALALLAAPNGGDERDEAAPTGSRREPARPMETSGGAWHVSAG